MLIALLKRPLLFDDITDIIFSEENGSANPYYVTHMFSFTG